MLQIKLVIIYFGDIAKYVYYLYFCLYVKSKFFCNNFRKFYIQHISAT